jgi:hypothetical protein
MIQLCPYCGHLLPFSLTDGFASCGHCNRVFDSSPYYRLLSGAWLAKKQSFTEPQQLSRYGFSEPESILIISFVIENQYSMEEFTKVLHDLGVSQLYAAQQTA